MRRPTSIRGFGSPPLGATGAVYGHALARRPNVRRRLRLPFLGYQSPLGLINAVAIGTLLMSPLGWQKLLLIGGNYYPEVCVIGLLGLNTVLDRRFITNAVVFFTDIRSIVWIIGCLALAVLGIAYHGQMLAAYADLRTCLVVGLAYVYASRASEEELQNEIFIALVVSLLATFLFYTLSPYDYTTPKRIFPTTALLAASYIGAIKKGGLVLYGTTAVGLAMVAISNYRSNYIIGVIVIVIAVYYGLVGPVGESRWVTARRRMTFMAAGAVTIAMFGPISSMALKYLSSDPDRYYQSVYKTTQMLELLQSGDYGDGGLGGSRLPATEFIIDHLGGLLLPSGLGDRAWEMNWHSPWMAPGSSILLNSVDGIHFFMFLHFGVILSVLLVVYVFWKWLRAMFLSPSREIFARVLLLIGLIAFVATFGGHIFIDFGFAVPSGLLFGIFARVSATRRRSWSVPAGVPLRVQPSAAFPSPLVRTK